MELIVWSDDRLRTESGGWMATSYERLTYLEGMRELRVPGLAAASSYFLSLISFSVS